MKLLTKALLNLLPPLGATDNTPASEVKVPVKLFNPMGSQTWYLTEYDPKTHTAFGFVDLGMGFPELGYISLTEIEQIRLPFGLTIERDLYWNSDTTLLDVRAVHDAA